MEPKNTATALLGAYTPPGRALANQWTAHPHSSAASMPHSLLQAHRQSTHWTVDTHTGRWDCLLRDCDSSATLSTREKWVAPKVAPPPQWLG